MCSPRPIKIEVSECSVATVDIMRYRKIPNVSPGLIIFQRTFMEAYFWRGLIFGVGLLLEGGGAVVQWRSVV